VITNEGRNSGFIPSSGCIVIYRLEIVIYDVRMEVKRERRISHSNLNMSLVHCDTDWKYVSVVYDVGMEVKRERRDNERYDNEGRGYDYEFACNIGLALPFPTHPVPSL
jgi:hypothetical protein